MVGFFSSLHSPNSVQQVGGWRNHEFYQKTEENATELNEGGPWKGLTALRICHTSIPFLRHSSSILEPDSLLTDQFGGCTVVVPWEEAGGRTEEAPV